MACPRRRSGRTTLASRSGPTTSASGSPASITPASVGALTSTSATQTAAGHCFCWARAAQSVWQIPFRQGAIAATSANASPGCQVVPSSVEVASANGSYVVSVGGVDGSGTLGQRQDVRRSGQRGECRAAVGRPKQRRRARHRPGHQQGPGGGARERCQRAAVEGERHGDRRAPVGGERQRVAARRPARAATPGRRRLDRSPRSAPARRRARSSDRRAARSRRRRIDRASVGAAAGPFESARSIVIGSDAAISRPVTRSPGAPV